MFFPSKNTLHPSSSSGADFNNEFALMGGPMIPLHMTQNF